MTTTFARVPKDSTNGRQHRLLLANAIGQLQDNVLTEEAGTWEPSIYSNSGSYPWTMSAQNGWYRKHGTVVWFQFDVQWTAKNAHVDNPYVNLPFSADLHSDSTAAPSLVGTQNPAISSLAFMAPYNGGIKLLGYTALGGVVPYANYASAGHLSGSGFYFTKS